MQYSNDVKTFTKIYFVYFQFLSNHQLIAEAREKHKATNIENSAIVEGEQSKPKIHFIIDQLINHEEKFSDADISDHLMTLLSTAAETTGRMVAACIMFMAIHQDVQQKAFDEIADILNDDEIDYERLNELKYIEMVLKETLRVFSPIQISFREATDDCDVGTGKLLKKGTKVFLLNSIVHQRKDLWGKNAGMFDPENFSPEKSDLRDPYSFVPFGMVNFYFFVGVDIDIIIKGNFTGKS